MPLGPLASKKNAKKDQKNTKRDHNVKDKNSIKCEMRLA